MMRVVLVGLVLYGGIARSQDLYRYPGAALAPVSLTTASTDGAGFVWERHPWPWVVSCYDPADRDGTLRSFNPFGNFDLDPEPWNATLIVDPTRADIFVVEQTNGVGGDTPVHVFRLRCEDIAAGEFADMERVAQWRLTPEVGLTMPRGEVTHRDGEACIIGQERIACMDLDAPAATEVVHVSMLDAAVDVDPGWDALLLEIGHALVEREGWVITAGTLTRGGSLFFVATRYWIAAQPHPDVTPAQFAVSWLIEVRADGTLDVRFEGIDHARALLPFAGLGFEALAIPVAAEEWSFHLGEIGDGLRVVPIDRDGIGYLSLTAAVEGLPHDQPMQVQPLPGDGLAIGFPTSAGTTYYEVRPALIDLDDDALDAATEAAMGTSDLLVDSDGGGTPDNLELLAGTRPTDGADDPGPSLRTPTAFVQSHLIGLRGGGGVCLSSTSVAGPLCCDGVCRDRRGGVVHTYDATKALQKSFDGSYLLVNDGDLVREHFDGRRDVVATASDLANLVPDADRFVAVDQRVWVARHSARGERDGVVALFDGGAGRVVYDHRQARLAAGFEAGALAMPSYFEVVGWHAESQRLFLSVDTPSDRVLVGIDAAGNASLVARGRSLIGWSDFTKRPIMNPYMPIPDVPQYLLATGHDYLTQGGATAPWLQVEESLFGGGYTYDSRATGAWGDTLIVGGGLELVRYDRSRIDPGDVLLVRFDENSAGDGGAMLYKSGPRGGLVPMWPRRMRDVENPLGVALSKDRRLCLVEGPQIGTDSHATAVYELEPAQPNGAPEIPIEAFDLIDALDCAYDQDDRLVVLTATELLRREAFGDALVVIDTFGGDPPETLVETPAGPIVQHATQGVRGQLYLADGRVATMNRDDWVLRIDGEPVADFPRLVHHYYGPEPRPLYEPDWPGDVTLVERPDGLILVHAHHVDQTGQFAISTILIAVDPETGASAALAGTYAHPYWGVVTETERTDRGVGLVRVPGGRAGDPWGGGDLVIPSETGGVDAPPAPTAPSDGEGVDVGCGCSGGATPWAWLVVVTLRRRRPTG